ncbi:type II toxin-antitoxin system RelE/ParE family toxin [Bifidobacterium crudilactis]|uniref:type II toxin-antitoxin system RelE/ParE family toxin n=1 Tax=Bifidobacterium crudilactis TaxID=327277 RepID=UPI0030B86F8A
MYTLDVWIDSTPEFDDWIDHLRDRRAKASIYARLTNIENSGQLVGDIHSVAGPLKEMRFHTGAGYRVYFIQHGSTLILLLGGGSKSTQGRDIKRLQRQVSQWKERLGDEYA